MDLYYSEIGKRYILACTYKQKDIAKRHGFAWDSNTKQWWTADDSRALALFKHAKNPLTRLRLQDVSKAIRERGAASRFVESDAYIPLSQWAIDNKKEYAPHQKACIMLGREWLIEKPNNIKGILIADDAGIGKTIEFLGILNTMPEAKKVLIVTTRTLKLNWFREISRWAVKDFRVEIYRPDRIHVMHHGEEGVIQIINFQLLSKYSEQLMQEQFDMLCVDECHLVSNPETKRAKALQGIRAEHEVFMTASPIMNRPRELFPIAQRCAPDQFPDFHSYGIRYCGAEVQYWQGNPIWNYNGATHCEELGKSIRNLFMIRREKIDLPHLELPAKIRRPIIFEASGVKKLLKRETELLTKARTLQVQSKGVERLSALGKQLEAARRFTFDQLATARKQTALAKLPLAIEHIEDHLTRESKLVVFAHHHAVIEPLYKHFNECAVLIWGKDKNEKRRQEAVDAFQHNDKVKLFLGNIEAAGVGITLTKAPLVVFVELDWRPFIMIQAEDRAHRIGSDHDHLLIEYLLVNGSSDARMIEALIEKEQIAERILRASEKLPNVNVAWATEQDYMAQAI
jgi:SWI/SNF-related matrix-associated actin-dependent regulator 1 of chromatin subfamily A